MRFSAFFSLFLLFASLGSISCQDDMFELPDRSACLSSPPELFHSKNSLPPTPTGEINRASPNQNDYIKEGFVGQIQYPNEPYYINRYDTMTLNYFNMDMPSTHRSPRMIQLNSNEFPDRCPGGVYNMNQEVTVLEITPDAAIMACVPPAVAPQVDPTYGLQTPLDYSAATPAYPSNICVQRRLSLKSVPGHTNPMIRKISGIEVLVMGECDIYYVQFINNLDRPDIHGYSISDVGNANWDIVHAHGMTPPYYLDGVPYVQIHSTFGLNGKVNATFGQMIPAHGGTATIKYRNPHYQQSGTYFIHSHYNFHHDDGVGMPLLLMGRPPNDTNKYQTDYATEYNKLMYIFNNDTNNDGTYDIMMYFEDFCPISYNEGPPPPGSTCAPAQNAFFALSTEWLQSNLLFSSIQCQPVGVGMDIDYTNHLCNNQSAENAYTQLVYRGWTYHIRTVNSAGMTNYLLTFDGLPATLIAVDGNWIVPKNVTSYWMAVAQRLDLLITIPEDAPANQVYRFMGYAEGTMYQAGVIVYVDDASGLQTLNPPVTLGPQFDKNDAYVPFSGARWYQDNYTVPLDPRAYQNTNMYPFLTNLTLGLPWLDPTIFAGMAGDMGMYDNTMAEANTTAWYGVPPKKPDRFYQWDITGNNGFQSMNLVSYPLPPGQNPLDLYYPDGLETSYNWPHVTPFAFEGQYPMNTNFAGYYTVNPALVPRPFYVVYNETVCVQVISHNTDAHAIHLHGHTFQVVEYDGISLGDSTTGWGGSRRDVLLTPRGQCRSYTFCFEAVNRHEGVHPLHCHMAYHLASGMLTTVNYVSEQMATAAGYPSATDYANFLQQQQIDLTCQDGLKYRGLLGGSQSTASMSIGFVSIVVLAIVGLMSL